MEYNGYFIEVSYRTFTIRERLSNGKMKVRRRSNADKYTGQRDRYGNKLYTGFRNDELALRRAKNFIDNHIVPWEEKQKLQACK